MFRSCFYFLRVYFLHSFTCSHDIPMNELFSLMVWNHLVVFNMAFFFPDWIPNHREAFRRYSPWNKSHLLKKVENLQQVPLKHQQRGCWSVVPLKLTLRTWRKCYPKRKFIFEPSKESGCKLAVRYEGVCLYLHPGTDPFSWMSRDLDHDSRAATWRFQEC